MIASSFDEMPAGEVLAYIRSSRALPMLPSRTTSWSFKVGDVAVTLPNFAWRRRAIDSHDLHHVLIDQPFTLKGECQVAIWEFAAGPYPDIRPQLFCLPLVAAGFAFDPPRAWKTFMAGRRQRSLYGLAISNTVRLGDLRAYVNTERGSFSCARDWLYLVLVLAASLLPVAALLALVIFALNWSAPGE